MFATGVNKQLRYKAESTWKTAPGASGAQLLRRVTSGLSKKKQVFESAEIVSHLQRLDYRHGMGSVAGPINGEFSPGTYKDFIAAAMRRDFTAISAISGASITIAGSGPTYTVTRAAGSFLTDGVKQGQVVRLSVGAFNAANLNKNLWVLSATATVLTVMPLNGVALVAEGPIAGSTVTAIGKVTYAPMTAQTDKSFAIEHWYADVVQSELFLGCKIDTLDIGITPGAMASISMGFMGGDMTPATAAYYTTPTAETTTGILAGPQGLLAAQGGAIALVTGLTVNYRGEMTIDPVLGSSSPADITEGRVLVGGQLTALFQDTTLRDYFLNETEVNLMFALAASTAAAADFVTASLPRIKFGGADKDDGPKSLVQTLPFVALLNVSGGAGIQTEQTTMYVQDSQA